MCFLSSFQKNLNFMYITQAINPYAIHIATNVWLYTSPLPFRNLILIYCYNTQPPSICRNIFNQFLFIVYIWIFRHENIIKQIKKCVRLPGFCHRPFAILLIRTRKCVWGQMYWICINMKKHLPAISNIKNGRKKTEKLLCETLRYRANAVFKGKEDIFGVILIRTDGVPEIALREIG